MSFWTKTVIGIILFQYLITISAAIIVEKNYYFYYKLPTEITADNTTENFFLLQCPYRATLEIPLLKEMSMCRIIARYGATTPQVHKFTDTQLPSNLRHTQVTYKLQQPNTIMSSEFYSPVPHKVIIKPMSLTQDHPTEFLQKAEQRVLSSVLPVDMSTTPIRRELLNDNKNRKTITTPTSLDFLDVNNIMDKLFKTHGSPKTSAIKENDKNEDENAHDSKEVQRFFTKQSKFGKGEKLKGFQNIYYRDEIFNDHIFYDEVDQRGNYRIQGKQ